VTVPVGPTIADGLRPDIIGRLPFAVCRTAVRRVVTVDEVAIADALCLALVHARMLIEPSAAAALAGALAWVALEETVDRDIGVVLTGGNVDPALVTRLLADRHPRVGAA
jgi:threonine dehydratase